MVFSAQEVFMAGLHFVFYFMHIIYIYIYIYIYIPGGGHGNPLQYTMYAYIVTELILQFCS